MCVYNPPSILAIGTAVPPYKISQQLHHSILESANCLGRKEKLQLRKIYTNSGIESRHSVMDEFGRTEQTDNILFFPSNHHVAMPISRRMELYEQYAPSLAENAVAQCLEALPGLSPSAITHLITFSCTGMSAPGLDIQLIERMGLKRNVERTCINFMGCYAGINALKTAYHISRSEPDAIVLLVGVELCTLHYQKNEKEDQIIANAIFGDGASACIVSSQKIESNKASRGLSLKNFYAEFEPGETTEMAWRIGDSGFDLRLSSYVPALIKKYIPAFMANLLNTANIKQEDIDFYAFHPGGVKILQACEEALHISKKENEISYQVLHDYGNMSSVTIFFVLKKLLGSLSQADIGKRILACAFGPGLTMEAMTAEIC